MGSNNKGGRSSFAAGDLPFALPDAVAEDLLGAWLGDAAVASAEPSVPAAVNQAVSQAAEQGGTPASGVAVTTDQADYAPGAEATITASGFRVGAAVRFALRDLASDPGADGEVDDYGSFVVVDGGPGDLDGVANGTVVTRWTVPSTNNGSPSSTPDALFATVRLTAQEVKAGPSGLIAGADAVGIGPVAVHLFTDAGVVDTTAPTLTGQYPAAGATLVPINHSIILTFSEAIVANGGTVKAQIGTNTSDAFVMTLTSGATTGTFSTPLSGGTWTIAGNKLIIDPTGNLSTSQVYNFDISAGALKDAAGNLFAGITSTSSSGIYFTAGTSSDTTRPSVIPSTVAFSADTGLSSTDFNTNQANQTITGTLSAPLAAGDLVQISLNNGSTWTYVDTCATGSSSFSHTATLLSGTNTLRVRVVDAAGLVNRPLFSDFNLQQSYTLDTTPPPAPTLSLGTGAADGVNQDEAVQASGVVTVRGSSGFLLTVLFQSTSGSVTKTLTANGNTQPVVLSAEDLPVLGTGVVNVSATQTDLAGNVGPAAPASFVFDAVPPTAKVLTVALGPDTAGAGTTGTTSDYLTNSPAQLITGTLSEVLAAGEEVRISTDNGLTWSAATITGNGTTFSFSTTLSGSNTLVLRVQDAVGNFSAPLTQDYVLDTAIAAPDLVLAPGVASGATFAEASNLAGVLTVTGELGGLVSVLFTGTGGSVSKSVSGQGATTPIAIVLSAAELDTLGNGTISVTASQIDPAGNASAASTASFVYDTVAPLAPVITTLPLTSNALNQRIVGTSEANALITLKDGNTVLGTTTADNNGNWQAVVYLKGQGAHTIQAWQRDAAGNDGPTPSAPLQITIDTVAPAPVLTKEDLQFIQLQIRIAEAHNNQLGGNAGITADFADGIYNVDASQAALRTVLGVGNDAQALGLRSVEGFNNNLQPNQARFGSADRTFSPATIGSTGVPTLTTNYDPDGAGGTPAYTPNTNVTDASPRLISTLIADQTTSNPAAVAAAQSQQALLDPELQKSANPQALQTQYDVKNQPVVDVLNVAPNPANAPYNSFLTLFGQGFDHGLDFIEKGGSGSVMVPLMVGDPLYTPGSPTNFIAVTRATVDAQGNTTNRTTPWIDMNQAYGSHSSMQVFLREYTRVGNSTKATGHLLDGSAGGLPTWADVKAQALSKLGILLTDQDVGNCPLIVADEYGRFIPGANGYAQVVLRTGGTDTSPILEIREGTASGLALTGTGYAALRTGHAFLLDMAHTANPGGKSADGDNTVGLKDANNVAIQPNQQGQYAFYDNELLDRHFIAGDGRVNENQGLTAFHTMFHNEHDRLVDDYKRIAVESGDLDFLNSWLLTPLTAIPASVSAIPADQWNGERLFQAGRFLTEMQYQHGVFEEFARYIDPNVAPDQGYQVNLDPAITREYANAVYRFGHSMLNETVDRFSSDWQNTSEGLIAAFVNPVAFLDPDNNGTNLTAADAGGEILRGMTRQQGNAIDEFVTGALRNNLLGLPLDLATINLVRARELGIPRLNDARQQFYTLTSNTTLAPYSNWRNFGANLKHPESLINFVAAYGQHPELVALRDPNNADANRVLKLRTIAMQLIEGTHINAQGKNDSADFMNAAGTFASRRAGVDDIDLWIGGLAEKTEAQVSMLGSTFSFVFAQQLQALQFADRLYYLRRLGGNLITQVEQSNFSALAQRSLNVSSLPGMLFSLATYTLEVDAAKQLTNLGNGKSDPLGANRVNASAAEIGFTVANTLRWTGGHVVLGGSEQADLLQGGNENDTLYGRGGNDVMIGGDGADQFWGGEGDDFMFDNAGLNLMRGEAGHDVIVCGSSLSILYGGIGKDWMIGSAAGGLGNEMNGETDDDFISAAQSGTVGKGGAGNDWFEGNTSGGADNYFLDDGLGGVVNIVINEGVADGVINPTSNTVPQAVGHDVSLSRAGDDKVFGDWGNDIFIDGSGFDDYSGQMGFDWVSFARNGRDPGGSINTGGAIDLSQILGAGVLRANVQADLTDLRVEAAAGSQYADVLLGDDRTDLVGGNVFLNRNNDLAVDGRDVDLVSPFGSLTLADRTLTGNLRNPVVNTHYAINPLTGQWGPAGGISINRSLDDRLTDLPLENGGIAGLFHDYTSTASGGGQFKSLIPVALQQTLEVNTRPHPLAGVVNPVAVQVGSVANSNVPGFPDVQGTITVPAYFNAGNVLIGGQGSDVFFGKAGDDVIDGDAWLNVELEWRNPSNPSQVVRFADMKAINDANLVLGLAIKPQDVYIVRELASNPYLADGVTRANDLAVYYGRPDEYLFEGQRRVYVASQAAGGILQTDATPVDYQEDPLTGFPINFPTNFFGSPDVREVDLNGNLLATTFDRNALLNNFYPRTTIIGAPTDVDGDGFITLTYAPTGAQLSDPLRAVALAPGVIIPQQGTDYLRNIEAVRFVLPGVNNPTGSPTDPLSGLVAPTAYSTYTSRVGAAGSTYTYSTFRDGSFVDVDVKAFMPTTAAVLPGVSNSSTPAPDPNTSKAINLNTLQAPLPTLTFSLTNDTGRSNSDNISKQADITVSGLPAGYLYQWSNTADYFSPKWVNLPGVAPNATSVAISQQTVINTFGLTQGVNTLYFRVIENKAGGRLGSSQAFSFTYDTSAPAAPLQTGAGQTIGTQTSPDPWAYEVGGQLFYDVSATGSFTATSQPATKPYYVLVEDAAGNRSAASKSAFFYDLQAGRYNDGNTTTPGNNTAGVGYLLVSNYQPGERFLVDPDNTKYFFIDNYTTADGKVGIGVFRDDGTGSNSTGKSGTTAVPGAWDGRDELLALIQKEAVVGAMFSEATTFNGSTMVSKSYGIDPAKVVTSTFSSTTTTRDALTGTGNGVIDTFKLASLSYALLPTTNTNLSTSFDRIISLNANEDLIDSPFARTTPIKPIVATKAVTALTTSAIASVLTKTVLAANGAATFTFGTGASTRTFLAMSDATAAFGSGDAVLEITGYTGSLANLNIF